MSVVVGYLDTPEGRMALAAAAEEGLRRGEPVVLVASLRGDVTAEDRAALERGLGEARHALRGYGVEHEVRTIERERDVADDLVGVATELAASVLVIGLRRRSPVGKLILGSNAQRILLDAPCPVLAVKPPLP